MGSRKNISLAVVGVGLAATLAFPVGNTDRFEGNVARAEAWRTYLKQSHEYRQAQRDIQGIPPSAIDKAAKARDDFENFLVKEKYVDRKGDTDLKKPPESQPLLEKVLSEAPRLVQTAYAFTFNKEDFESCGALPCTFDSNESYGTGSAALDATSQVNGTDSLLCTVGASDSSCRLRKDLGSDDDEVWYQFYIKLQSGYSLGASGFVGIFASLDSSNTELVWLNLEDYGTNRLILSGNVLSYTDTSIDLAANTLYRIEMRIKKSATVGDVDIWVNSTTEGSPTYNGSGTLNTGATLLDRFYGGIFYSPSDGGDIYFDDFIADQTGFIGSGSVSVPDPDELEMSRWLLMF